MMFHKTDTRQGPVVEQWIAFNERHRGDADPIVYVARDKHESVLRNMEKKGAPLAIDFTADLPDTKIHVKMHENCTFEHDVSVEVVLRSELQLFAPSAGLGSGASEPSKESLSVLHNIRLGAHFSAALG